LAKAGRCQTPEQALDEARRWLNLSYLLDDEPGTNGKTFSESLDQHVSDYVVELAGEHSGDCVCFPCSCVKCHAESLLGVDTIPGLGKHSAYKVGAAFK